MTKWNLIIVAVTSLLFKVNGQNIDKNKLTFYIDTVKGEGYKYFGSIPNRPDSATIFFDCCFEHDTISLIIDGQIKYRKILNRDPRSSDDTSGSINIPKTKKMILTFILNGQNFGSIKFNKDFCTTHLNYFDKKLVLTYTNQVYIYE